MKTASPVAQRRDAIIGRVIKGMEVVDKLADGDVLKNVYVKGEGPK